MADEGRTTDGRHIGEATSVRLADSGPGSEWSGCSASPPSGVTLGVLAGWKQARWHISEAMAVDVRTSIVPRVVATAIWQDAVLHSRQVPSAPEVSIRLGLGVILLGGIDWGQVGLGQI